jgi:hypothetical protein
MGSPRLIAVLTCVAISPAHGRLGSRMGRWVIRCEVAGCVCGGDRDGWSRSFGPGGEQLARAMVVDAADRITIVGGFDSTIDFGWGPLTSSGTDAFVVKYPVPR